MPLKSWSRSLIPTLMLLALPALSMAQMSVNVSVNVPPPELPVYDQPPIPGDGYIWTPGYWAWGDDIQDYYWVPGTWVLAPQPEYLWTPGYWGWSGGVFLWNAGYWGPHVGFYGGVNYGYGYGGSGFEGGYWQGGRLYYNRSVTNVGTTNITNVYNKTVINNVTVNHVSYNGGSGGIRAQATSAELAAAHEPHIAAIPAQRQQEQAARGNPVLRASTNKGHPPIAATARPGAFSGAGVVGSRGGTLSVVHAESAPRNAQPGVESRPAAAPPGTAAAPRTPAESRTPVDPRQVQPPPSAPQSRPAPPKPKAEPHPEHPEHPERPERP
jgi:YXWGXW repeat-containing protein